jgi:hypothetical protein
MLNMRKSLWLGVLLFAAISARDAHADSLTDPNGTIIFPDGSVITSDNYVASTAANGYSGYTDIAFQFSGGTGFASNLSSLGAGESGHIVYTESVSNVSIYWQYSYGLYMNFFSDDFGELGSFTEPVCATYPVSLCSGVVSFTDPGAFEMTWTTNQSGYSVSGVGGIDALSYTAIPEPSAGFLLLTGVGLLGLIMVRKRVARGHIATTRMRRARTQISLA